MNKDFKGVVSLIQNHYEIQKGEIAERLGVTRQYLSRVITGASPFTDALRQKVESAFPDIEIGEQAAEEAERVNQGFKSILGQIKRLYGINQGEIAQRLGVTPNYLSDVSGGRVPYNEKLKVRIQETFKDVKVDGCNYIPSVEESVMVYLRERLMTVSEVADELGVSAIDVTETIAGGFDKNSARIWSEKFGFNMNYLLTGEGSLFDIKNGTVPLIPITAQAGRLSDFAHSVSEYECERIVTPVKDAELAIPVTGESMYPEFPSGSIVFVKKINEKVFIEWGKPYVLDTVNGAVVKYLAPGRSEGSVKCISANQDPMYAPFEIPMAEVYGIYRIVTVLCMK